MEQPTPTRLFLSYSRSDDEAFVRRLYDGLTAAGFEAWFDRVSMPSRQLTFSAEIEAAITACDRLVLVVGPSAVASDYVTHEWRFAFHQAVICVNPIVRLNGVDAAGETIDGYELLPEDLRGPHVEDFRDDSAFDSYLANLVRQLSEALPPVGKLVAVPTLPDHYLEQGDRIRALRDMVLADLRKPVVVSAASGRVGLYGMGGIGKSLLANALARRPEIRREFPDGVYWVTLGQQPALVQLQHDLAKSLGDQSAFTTAEQGRERLRELLQDRAALLILDDAWHREHAEAFNVIGPRCRILLTTRDSSLVTALAAKENHYQVQLPTVAESRAMLAKAAGMADDRARPAESGAVVEECDRLPLALALCGGMVYGGTSWTDLLEALREHDLQYLSDAHPGEEQHANVWKAIDVSVRVLGEAERRRFAELAVFALDAGAQEAAVETLWAHTARLSGRNARKLLRDFAARSLVQLSDGRMTLHDLVHGFATGMTADAAALHRVLLDAYRAKCPDGWPSGPNDEYFLENLCGHLVAGGSAEDAAALLASARWGLAKCGAGLALSLERDYGTVTQDEALRLLHGALVLSMHVLAVDRAQYASQMTGRLLAHRDKPAISEFLDEVTAAAPRPWIRPLHLCFDAPGGPLVRTLDGGADTVYVTGVSSVAVTPDGKLMISTFGDKVLVWDLEAGRVLHTLAGHSEVVNAVALTADGKQVVSASQDDTLRVWDLESGRTLRTLEGHTRPVKGVAITADGRWAVSASYDRTLKVWELASGRTLFTLEGHTYSVNGVAVTPDGKRAISASGDGTLRVWDLSAGRALRTLEGHSMAVSAVAATADGTLAVSASDDKTLKVWDLESGAVLGTLAGHSEAVSGVAVTADGTRAVSASHDKTLKVWNLKTGRPLCTLPGHSWHVNSVAVTADGKRVVSASDDSTLKVWELANAHAPQTAEGHSNWIGAVAATVDAKRVVSASGDHTLKVWDLESGRVLRTLEGHKGWVTGVAVMADGRSAVSVSYDESLKVWDLESGRTLFTLEGRTGSLTGVALTADGKRAVSLSDYKTLTVWDLETRRALHTLATQESQFYAGTGVAVAADGKIAVSASDARTLKVWDLESGVALRTLEGHSSSVTDVALTMDGKRAVSASSDHVLKIWDLETGSEVLSLAGHANSVNSVALTTTGKRAVSASWDGALRLWDLETGAVLAAFYCEAAPFCCACAAPKWIVAGDQGGRIYFLALEE